MGAVEYKTTSRGSERPCSWEPNQGVSYEFEYFHKIKAISVRSFIYVCIREAPGLF
jgi:hypothetical protein